MKINFFGLGKSKEDWKMVKDELHQVWCMNQRGALLPACCDMDFQKQFNYVKKKYGYKLLCEKLSI